MWRVESGGQETCLAEGPSITIDDMNDWTTLFEKGNSIKTPSMGRLVAREWLFERMYCTSPACAPSRISIMRGTALPPSQGNRGQLERLDPRETLSVTLSVTDSNVLFQIEVGD